MTERDEIERLLPAHFAWSVDVSVRPGQLDAIVAATSAMRPRPDRLARLPFGESGWLRPTRTRAPIGVLLLLAGVVLALLAGSLLTGGRRAPTVLVVVPQASQSASTSPIVTDPSPTPSDPVIELPAGLSHRLSVADVERAVLAEMQRTSAGLVSGPTTIRRVTLVPPNTTYSYPRPDASGDQVGSVSHEVSFWLVEVDGTATICGSFCDASDRVEVQVFDAESPVHPCVCGYPDPTRVYPVPAQSFREALAAHGLAFEQADLPANGILDATAALAHLDAARFPAADLFGTRPNFGAIVVTDPKLASATGPITATPTGGGTRPIWFVQLMDAPWSWAVVDAVTGTTLDSGVSMTN